MDARERLEIEDEDERQKRLGQLFMRIDQAGDNALSTAGPSAIPSTDRIGGGLTPAPVEPPTELLDRVRQFLPQFAESNASLSGRDQHELDIENISDDGRYYIEMNLGLGVFEYRSRGTRPDEGPSASSSTSSSSTNELDGEDDDSDSSGSSSPSEDGAQASPRPKKPLPRRVTPKVTVLNESETPSGGSLAQTSSTSDIQ